MQRIRLRVAAYGFLLASAAPTLLACGESSRTSSTGSSGAMGGSGMAGSTGAMGSSGTASTMGSAGSATGGSMAGAGSTGVGAADAGRSSTGGDAGAGGPGTDGGASDAGIGGDGPVATAGCTNNNYQLCIDFENGIDTTTWTGGTPGAIVTTEFAHGGHSYRLYPMGGGVLKTAKLGTIKDQLWSRFYVHFKPGAPGGHGNIIGAYDQSNNWYEIGWQFDAIMGVWHATGGAERPLRSTPLIVDQWYCVESFFDGTKTNMPQWWIDGLDAQYYMAANTTLIPKVVTQFVTITAGFTPYAGLGLQMPGKPPTDTRVLTDMWIDDIAFDTKRIGCIQ